MSATDQIRVTFFQECEELLETLQDGLLALQDQSDDSEIIHSIFRAVHSIKGGAGAFGFDHLVEFAHEFEAVLDLARTGAIALSGEVITVFLRSSDMLSDLIAAAQADRVPATDLTDELIATLSGMARSVDEVENESGQQDVSPGFEPVGIAIDLTEDHPGQDSERCFTIRFRPHDALYRNGNETALILRDLARLGEAAVSCNTANLPEFDQLDPEISYLSWEICLTTSASRAAVIEIFEFVDGVCDLEVIHGVETDADNGEIPQDRSQNVRRETIRQVDSEGIAGETQTHVLPAQESNTDSPIPPYRKTELHAEPTGNASVKPDPPPIQQGPVATVRVDVAHVDRLINLVGELVMNQAMLTQCFEQFEIAQATEVTKGLDELGQLSREIQDGVMAIRAQPVKPLFQRMFRIVREAAADTGKEVRLDISGEMTEVDKTVIEKLADPLTHMLRNAVDHGLETPEQRNKAGKPAEGVIRLSAAHRSGRVIIDVADDGAGIDLARVQKIAADKGFISEGEVMSPTDIDALLFRPGFSTVKTASNLSGRGVGMDVVKNAIRALGGRIAINSTPGAGSTFSISLPLTLAVLDGIVVEISSQKLVIPINVIVETMQFDIGALHPVGESQVLAVRGEFVPAVEVAQVLGFHKAKADAADRIAVLTESDEGTRCALLVDRILDQRQVVIKGLEANYGHVPGIAAATILGDGTIALILDTNDALFLDGSAVGGDQIELAKTG